MKTPKPGDTIVFRGVMFDDGWEFDAPCIIYSPCKLYSPNGGNTSEIESLVEDACIDLCMRESIQMKWSSGELKEFKWRGWSPDGFRRRKGWHVTVTANFYEQDGELTFTLKKAIGDK